MLSAFTKAAPGGQIVASPRASVVLPTVRGGAYLREAVHSVLSQTMSDWELLIVSDGCSDDLSDLESLDGRIRVLRQRNRGVAVARNVGMRAARSDLIALLDDDDRMLPDRLRRQVELMESAPDVGLCHTGYRLIDGAGRLLTERRADDGQYEEILRCELFMITPTIMYRKSLAEELGTYDAMLRTGEDTDLVTKIARESRIACIPDALGEYRRHSDNVTVDPDVFRSTMNRMLHKHLEAAQRRGERRHVDAARAGLTWMRGCEYEHAMRQARAEWHHQDVYAAARNVGKAFGWRADLATKAITRAIAHRLGAASRRLLGPTWAVAAAANLSARSVAGLVSSHRPSRRGDRRRAREAAPPAGDGRVDL